MTANANLSSYFKVAPHGVIPAVLVAAVIILIGAGACGLDQTCRDLTITNGAMPDGAVGAEYKGHITVDSNCGWWRLEGDHFVERSVVAGAIPPGLDMDAFGEFRGLPTQAGKFQFTVQASNIIRFIETRKDLAITIR